MIQGPKGLEHSCHIRPLLRPVFLSPLSVFPKWTLRAGAGAEGGLNSSHFFCQGSLLFSSPSPARFPPFISHPHGLDFSYSQAFHQNAFARSCSFRILMAQLGGSHHLGPPTNQSKTAVSGTITAHTAI